MSKKAMKKIVRVRFSNLQTLRFSMTFLWALQNLKNCRVYLRISLIDAAHVYYLNVCMSEER